MSTWKAPLSRATSRFTRSSPGVVFFSTPRARHFRSPSTITKSSPSAASAGGGGSAAKERAGLSSVTSPVAVASGGGASSTTTAMGVASVSAGSSATRDVGASARFLDDFFHDLRGEIAIGSACSRGRRSAVRALAFLRNGDSSVPKPLRLPEHQPQALLRRLRPSARTRSRPSPSETTRAPSRCPSLRARQRASAAARSPASSRS